MDSVIVSRPESNCITFMIPTDRIKRLRLESEIKNITLNTIVNQIISDHALAIGWLHPHELYYLPKAFLIRVLNSRRLKIAEASSRYSQK